MGILTHQLEVPIIIVSSLLVLQLWVIQASSQQPVSLAKPGCNDTCGNVTIPYPFGIGPNCFASESFMISCENNQSKPFLSDTNFEVLDISLDDLTVSINNPLEVNKSRRFAAFLDTHSQFTAVLAWTNGPCPNGATIGSESICGKNASCWGVRSPRCECNVGFEGNPYLPQGCQDIDECVKYANGTCFGSYCTNVNTSSHQNQGICFPGTCHNNIGDYVCSCPSGYNGQFGCYKIKDKRSRMAIIGTSIGLGILFLLIGTWWLYKIMKKRAKAKLKKKFFKRNGGLLLQQQLASGEQGNVEKTKLFTSKELEKATDHYNKNRVLGQGGQGTVYKGMLTDGRIVAIKKSKIEDEGKVEHFINEVVILSQINHRNVVKLHGCCLETEVPMLVYEFIPNGTLFEYIHDQNEEFPLSCWDVRLRIAIEVAGALSYLHSAASIPIYHRDIKSTNILLDDKYRSKVADFGTSRSIAIDQTHLTTRVLGTFGYLDPEYFQSSQFTEKSDVYSFGVVLVELLTGQKPISSTRTKEGRSLATHFIFAMKENRLFDIIDARVLKEGGKEEIMGVANLAKRCLNLNGKKRPAMKEVAMELEGIRKSHGAPTIQQHIEEEVEYATSELTGPWDTTSISTRCSMNNSGSLSLDVQPLLFK